MSRPIWEGFISFGLVSIPVSIVPLEDKNELQFHLLDARDHSRIRYQRINTETGKEVPWSEVVKAYEIEKNSYVIMQDKDFSKVSPDAYKSVEINEFVHLDEIAPLYYEKPYYLLPKGKNKKSYVLLREVLKKTSTAGVGKVIIRTREYLCLIIPNDQALILNLIRFEDELRDESEFKFPQQHLKAYKIKEAEIKMATELVHKMTKKWHPEKYHDDYHDAILKWIKNRAKNKPVTIDKPQKMQKQEDVIDFVALLKKSLEKKTIKKSIRKRSKK